LAVLPWVGLDVLLLQLVLVHKRYVFMKTFKFKGILVFGDFVAVVPKVCSTDFKGSATSSQGILSYISVVATVKFTYLFN
jgi:hypothetical protein